MQPLSYETTRWALYAVRLQIMALTSVSDPSRTDRATLADLRAAAKDLQGNLQIGQAA